MIPILFLSANPDNADTLLAGDELRQIEAALKGSRFEVIAKPAARLEDLPDLLRQSQAAIVHFSGHGSHYGELMFVNEQGESRSASIPALAKLFELFKGQVRCVVLNACYSDEQATAIAEQVECVLGFAGTIRDDAARAFARGFYSALAAGETLARAKAFGLNEIERRYPNALSLCHLVGQGDVNALRPVEWDEVEETNAPLPANQFHIAGGTAIAGDANVGGDFVNCDKIEGDKVEGDKVTGNKTVIQQQIIYQGTQPATRHSSLAIFTVPFPRKRPEEFVGRDEDLARLHQLLQNNRAVGIRPNTALTGMGGIGKTQLAVEYAYRQRDYYSDGIFWINAADPNRFRVEMALAADRLLLTPEQSANENAKLSALATYLRQQPNSLLIFDNVQDPARLKRQLQQEVALQDGEITLLITTRRRDLPSQMQPLDLQRLSQAAARNYLSNARPNLLGDLALPTLLQRTGCLPLMLTLAATALKLQPDATIHDYLSALDQHGVEEVHSYSRLEQDDYYEYHEYLDYSLTPALREQWKLLCAQPESTAAQLLLRIAGQLPEAAEIPIARLSLLAGVEDKGFIKPLSKGLKLLADMSLVERLPETQAIRLHPLVRDFAEWLTPVAERNNFRSQCAQSVADAYAINESGLRRLGNEYATRGIAPVILDLITAINLCQFLNLLLTQSPISNHSTETYEHLESLLRLLRLEANKLQHPTRQPEQLWQQLLPRTPLTTDTELTQSLLTLLQHSLHCIPLWGYQRQSIAIEQTLSAHGGSVTAVAVIDSKRIVSASSDCTLKVWNLESGVIEQTLRGHNASVDGVSVIDSKRIVSASHDGTLKVWNLESGAVEQTFSGYKVAMIDSKRIVSASPDGTLEVWNLESREVEQTLSGHESLVNGVAVIDGKSVVSASSDGTLKVWNLESGAVEQTMRGHKAGVLSVARIDSKRIVFDSDDYTLKVWNLESGEVEQTLCGHESLINGVAVIDSKRIVSASYDHMLKVWNLESGEVEQTLIGHEASVNSVAVIDLRRVVSASDDGMLKVWNLESGAVEYRVYDFMINGVAWFARADGIRLRIVSRYEASVESVAVIDTVDGIGPCVVSASSHGTLKVWNLESGAVEQTLSVRVDSACSVAVIEGSDDIEPRIVFASDDHTLKVWNLESGAVEQTLSGHEASVLGVAVIDGKRIVSASDDRTLKVWNLESGAVEQTLSGHEDWVRGVAVIDGKRIVSASSDRTLKVWNLETGQVIASIGLDGAPQCVVVARHEGRTLVVAGDAAGALYCLELVEPKG